MEMAKMHNLSRDNTKTTFTNPLMFRKIEACPQTLIGTLLHKRLCLATSEQTSSNYPILLQTVDQQKNMCRPEKFYQTEQSTLIGTVFATARSECDLLEWCLTPRQIYLAASANTGGTAKPLSTTLVVGHQTRYRSWIMLWLSCFVANDNKQGI